MTIDRMAHQPRLSDDCSTERDDTALPCKGSAMHEFGGGFVGDSMVAVARGTAKDEFASDMGVLAQSANTPILFRHQ